MSPEIRRPKILLIDDSHTVLLTARMLLTEYDLIAAGDGEEGVAMALQEDPDLILLDVVMPRMDGFEACRRLRQHRSTADVPILMMTTRGEPGKIQAGYESGCTEYITKPFDGAELLAKIRTFLGQQTVLSVEASGVPASASQSQPREVLDLDGPESENQILRRRLGEMERELQRNQRRIGELMAQLRLRDAVSQDRAPLSAGQRVSLERRLANLCALQAAAQEIGAAESREQVLATISDVMLNLVGSGEFGVFEVFPDAPSLTTLASVGIDDTSAVPMTDTIRRVAATGSAYVADSAARDTPLRACFPLKAMGNVIGVVAIFGLLPQKLGIEPFDREVFGLLGTQAAWALMWLDPSSAAIHSGGPGDV